MTLNFQNKQKIIAEVKEISKSALSAVIADFRGITVNKINTLRKKSLESGVYMRVIRNTLLNLVVKDTQFECLKNTCVGPTMIAFSLEHPADAARIFKEFSIENTKFKIKAAVFEGQLILASQIDQLANLPTYLEVVTSLIAIMKEMSAGKLVRVLAAIRDAKEVT